MKIILRLVILALLIAGGFWIFWKGESLPVSAAKRTTEKPVKVEPPPVPIEPLDAAALFVSPSAEAGGDGTRTRPFRSLESALAALPASGEGTIALMEGTYRNGVSIDKPATGSPGTGRLRILAVPGEEVFFEGGEPITQSEPWRDEPGMYVVKAPNRETTFGASESGYLDVFDPVARIRYRKQFDADGVRAFPGSVCELDAGIILIHTLDGRDPVALGLWRNRLAHGLSIHRDRVVVEGIHFRNYLGGIQSRAVTIIKEARDVEIRDCRFSNCVRGMSLTGVGARIRRCDFRDVGLGIVAYGTDTQVENCLFQSAVGAFAISDLNQHLRDGIRFYAPAIGGGVRGCTTVGFWAGLYVKTYTDTPTAQPMVFENNRFLDGIMPGSTGKQPLNQYLFNIIGPNDDGVDPMHSPLLKTATLKGNYFFDGGGSGGDGNMAGPSPFVSLTKGDLTLRSDVPLPKRADGTWSQLTPHRVDWTPAIAALLRKEQTVASTGADEPLRLLAPPTVTAGAAGALVAVSLTAPAKGILYYRKQGDADWRALRGSINRPSKPEVVMGVVPIAVPAEPEPFALLFALLEGRLQAETTYEFYLELTADKQESLTTQPETFVTRGGGKQIHVRAGAEDSLADGTAERPFSQLQAALNRTLPGDTVMVEKGVYTRSAFLSHGGTSDAPLIIQGVGAEEAIFDSGREAPVLLELSRAGHVHIRDLQFRWFGNAGLSATQSPSGRVERCRFLNATIPQGSSPNGDGIVLIDSPDWIVTGSLFVRMEHGVAAYRSPRLTLTYNTAFRTMYAAASLFQSTAGSTLIGNSFTFAGNDMVTFKESSSEPFATLTCDFNNYGSAIRKMEPVRPENEFQPAVRYGYQSESKHIVSVTIDQDVTTFPRMADWQKFSGQDKNSVFADPEYADPLAAEFQLLPKSPNILPARLPDGHAVIGAFPVVPNKKP